MKPSKAYMHGCLGTFPPCARMPPVVPGLVALAATYVAVAHLVAPLLHHLVDLLKYAAYVAILLCTVLLVLYPDESEVALRYARLAYDTLSIYYAFAARTFSAYYEESLNGARA